MKHCLTLLLAAALCITPAAAHVHPSDVPGPRAITSPWAQDGVEQAEKIGFGLSASDHRVPISREDFTSLMMQYVAIQENFDTDTLGELADFFWEEKDEYGKAVWVFQDAGWVENRAYYLGLVKGRGDGVFDPEGLITRQEAAVMLVRAYEVCGGILPEPTDTLRFTDEAQIAEWARESVGLLADMGVMGGLEDNSFSAHGNYTVEQCMLTLLRLYQYASVNAENKNTGPLFSYEQCMQYIHGSTDETIKTEGGPGQYVETEIDGPIATFVRVDQGGFTQASAFLYFVYHDGGMQSLDIGLCSNPWTPPLLSSGQATENCRFSEDGRTFYCEVVLRRDIEKGETIVHAAGPYHITVDVESRSSRADWGLGS